MDDPHPTDLDRQPHGLNFFVMLALHGLALWLLFHWFRSPGKEGGEAMAVPVEEAPVPPANEQALPPEIQEKFFTLLDKQSLRLPTLSPLRALPGEERAPSPIVLPTEERVEEFQRAELARREEEARRQAELDALSTEREKAVEELREQELARQAAAARAEAERVARLKEAEEARERAEKERVAKAEEKAEQTARAEEERRREAKLAEEKAAKEKAAKEKAAKEKAERERVAKAEAAAKTQAEAKVEAEAKAAAEKARAQRAKPVTPGTAVAPARPVARATAVGEGGQSGGGGGGDDAAGDLDWYDRNVLYPALYRNWIQPRGPDFAGKNFQVQVRIAVKADGTIIEKRVTRGSGNAVVDKSVEEALEGFNRAGPLPSSFTGSTHSQSFTFVLD